MSATWLFSEAIPPAYTEHLGKQLLAHIGAEIAPKRKRGATR